MVKKNIIRATIAILLLASILLPTMLLPNAVSAAASTVDSNVTNTLAINYPFQRNTFYSDGRYWVFYSDGTNEVFQSSVDGSSWSGKTTVRACTDDDHFSLWYDTNTGYVHYSYNSFVVASSTYYRMGNPNADGTLTWAAAEQVAVAGTAGDIHAEETIAIDSTGHPWISYEWWDNGTCIGARVTRSDNTNGTWSTTAGYPYPVNTLSPENAISTMVLPLASGKMVVLWAPYGNYVGVREYNGSSWEDTVYTSNTVHSWEPLSAVSDMNDEIHIAFRNSTYIIRHAIYNANTHTLGSESTIASTYSSYAMPSMSIDITNNEIYCFWGYYINNHIYYNKYAGGAWLGATDWIDESANGGVSKVIAFHNSSNDMIGLLYKVKSSSPYSLKFNLLSMEPEPTPTPTGTPAPTPTPSPTPAPPAGENLQPIIGGNFLPLSQTDIKYTALSGGYSWGSTETYYGQLVSTDGNITNLAVKLDQAPGSGKSYTFALMLNGVPTSLSVTISGTSTQVTDSTHRVSVGAGDYITLRCTPSGSPTSGTHATWSSVFASDYANESLILGNVGCDSSTVVYAPIAAGYTSSTAYNPYGETEVHTYQVIPTGGKIKNLYVNMSGDPGTAPDAYKFTLRLNGGNTTLTCTVTADNTTANDTTHEVTVAAGDLVDIMIEPLNSPSATYQSIAIGMTFEADTDGESIILGQSSDTPTVGVTEYNYLTTTHYINYWWTVESSERQMLQSGFGLKNFYVWTSSATASQKLIKIVVNGYDSGITIILPPSTQTGSDTTHSRILNSYDVASISCYTSSNPTRIHWGIVAYETSEPTPTPTPTPTPSPTATSTPTPSPSPTVTPTPTPTPTPSFTPTPTPTPVPSYKIEQQTASIADCLGVAWYWNGSEWIWYIPGEIDSTLHEMIDGETYRLFVYGDNCDLTYSEYGDYYYFDLVDGWNEIVWQPYIEITAPDIETRPATYVSVNLAQLNAHIITDGGTSGCSVRFQYYVAGGTPWEHDTPWEYIYYTGDYYSKVLTGRLPNTTYYFRAQIKVGYPGSGTDSSIVSGDSLYFKTATTIGDPSDCLAIPRIDEPAIDLTWTKAAGSLTSIIRYKIGSYPTSYFDGILAGETQNTSIAIDNLIPGTTYYIRIWGKAGTTYSSGYTSCIATASLVVPSDSGIAPNAPTDWVRDVQYTRLSGMPGYGVINMVADEFGISREFFWGAMGFMIAIFCFVVAYIITKGQLLTAGLVMLVILGAEVPMGLTAGFIVFIWVLPVTMFAVLRARA